MKRQYLVLTGCIVALSCTLPARAEDKPGEKGVVPFEILKTGHMTVQVKVNGKGPYKLIFDTGAPINLLNNRIAKDAGLLKGMARPPIALFGSAGDVKVKELEVGGQKITNVPAVVMDHPTVEAISQAFGPIDGIVGFPFFARFKMTLDYQAKKMTFEPNGFNPPDVLKAMQAAMMSMLTAPQGPQIVPVATQWGLTVDKKTDDEEAGVNVTRVLPGSPADQAGIKEGDRLLTIDSRWTDTVADTFTAAGHVKPGATVPVEIQREGKKRTVQVKPLGGL